MNLLQLEVKAFRDEREAGHVFFATAGMAADEVGDYLLTQPFTSVNVIKNLLECFKLREFRLAHKSQDSVAGVLGCYLQASAHMAAYQFLGVGIGGFVGGFIAAAVQKKVIAHTTAYKSLLYARQTVHRMVNVEQFAGVGVKIGAYLGMYARRTLAVGTCLGILARHAIHIG